MRSNGNAIVPDGVAKNLQSHTAEYVSAFRKSQPTEYRNKLSKLKRDTGMSTIFDNQKALTEEAERMGVAKSVLRQVCHAVNKGHVNLQKAGVTTTLGYNFYDLRGPAQLLYPVNVPFRNSLSRVGKTNAGTGTVANWKYTTNPGTAYAGVPEGQRSQVRTPNEVNAFATYKELGDERSVTFTAEFAGEGYTDNLADEHLRGLHSLWLQEESLMLFGNSGAGAGANGFALGTPVAPTVTSAAGAGFATGSTVSVAVVLLTALGNPANGQYGYLGGVKPSVASGLTPSFSYNAPGTATPITIAGGTSAISPLSAMTTTTSGNGVLTATLPAANVPNGTFGYAWFVSTNATPTLANSYLAAITQFPTYTFTAAATGTQAGNAAGLNTDNSFEPYDFDGLFTYAAKYGTWTDLRGASLTSQVGGVVAEVETVLENLFLNYQVGVDTIWGSPDAIKSFGQAILYNAGGAAGYQFFATRDSANNLVGSLLPSAYQSRYAVNNPTGAGAIPLKMHPMIPPGTLFFDINTNPYPHSRVPFIREMYVQRDYYSIEWPPVARAWAFGTYVHEVLAHYMPWATAVITGIGPFTA